MAVTTRDLDRLVSRTELGPYSKQALREVRKAVLTGRSGDPQTGEAEWYIGVVTKGGSSVRFRFSMKKV